VVSVDVGEGLVGERSIFIAEGFEMFSARSAGLETWSLIFGCSLADL
jgi:hypothetical protein